MQAAIETRKDESVAIELEQEAARAVIASIVFAARHGEGIAPVARVMEARFEGGETQPVWRSLCQ